MLQFLFWLPGCGGDEVEPPPPLPDTCLAPVIQDTGGLDSDEDTGETSSGHWLVDCEVQDVDGLVTARQVRVQLNSPGTVRLCCAHQTEPQEQHWVSSEVASTEHLLSLQGLLADTNYECRAEVTQEGSTRQLEATFSTGSLPDWVRLPELSGDPERSWGAYTLLNHFVNGKDVDEQKLLIFDRHGRVRWYLDLQDNITNVDASYLGDGTVLYGGGYGAPPRVIDLFNNVLFQGAAPVDGVNHHHDTEMLPSGRIAALFTTRDQLDEEEWTGFGVEVIEVPSGEIVWSYASQTAVDAGELAPGEGDPWHANALQIIEEDGVLKDVYVNLRDINVLVRIDPETERHTSVLGPGGDYELLDADGDPADEADWFYWPHSPEVAGDRVLFYDNRNPRPTTETSRAVEFTLDEEAQTAQVSWEWTERNFREQAWGDVDALPSGDVLVTIAHCEACELSDTQGRSAVVEVERETGDVLWRLTWPEATDGLYRADRIDGCALFANARYCPSIRSK